MTPLREPNLPWREVDGRAVVLSPRTGNIHELNEVGTLLWANSDGKTNLESLAALVCETFDVALDVARADTQAFFSELESLGLLRRG